MYLLYGVKTLYEFFVTSSLHKVELNFHLVHLSSGPTSLNQLIAPSLLDMLFHLALELWVWVLMGRVFRDFNSISGCFRMKKGVPNQACGTDYFATLQTWDFFKWY